MALLKLSETLAVGCGSAEASALRALRAATWAGVACCGAGMLSQNPRALMMSAGVSGATLAEATACSLGSAFSAAGAAGAGLGAEAILASAAASCRVEAAGFAGFSAGFSTGLAAAATTVVLTGFSFLTGAGGAPSSSSSLVADLLLNREARKVDLVATWTPSPLPRRSRSALASS